VARRSQPVAPWSRSKTAARELSPDEKWALEIRERVLADAHECGQAAAISDPWRFFTMLVGRGGGKTTTFKGKYMLGLSSVTKGRFVYAAPTREMATDLLWDPLKDTCEKLGVEADFKEVGKVCRFRRTGARLKLVGCDDRREMGKLRGQPFDGVGMDEVCELAPELVQWFVDRIITPRIGERLGWFGLGSTPGHVLDGLFYELTKPGGEKHRPHGHPDWSTGFDGWKSYHWSLRMIAALPEAATRYRAVVANWTAALETKKREKWSDENPIWLREYEGVWVADNTENVFKYRPEVTVTTADGAQVQKLWNRWDPPMVRRGDAAIAQLPNLTDDVIAAAEASGRKNGRWEPDWLYAVAMDKGTRDPFGCNVFASSPTDPQRRTFHVFGFEQTEMYAQAIAKLLLGPQVLANLERAHDKPGGVIGAIGQWPDGMVMDADEAMLLELERVYGIRVAKAEKKADYKFGAIEGVNGDLVDGRLKILKGSLLEQQLASLQWAKDEFGFLRENKAQANHSSDTLVYGRRLLSHLFETAADEPKKRAPRALQPVEPTLDAPAPDPGGSRGEFDDLFKLASFDDIDFG